jgi:hypothetical protein
MRGSEFMSCVLRVSGEKFDVDAFCMTSHLVSCQVWHVGEKAHGSRPPSTTSGFNVSVSDANFDQFSASIQDAINFICANREELQRMSASSEISDITLDFAVAMREETMAKYCRFPAELIRLVGEFKMEIELSVYACSG